MVIAKAFDLRYDPEQVEQEVTGPAYKFEQKGTDGHLEFELQKHMGANKHLYYNVPDKIESDKDNYHLFYDVDVESQKITLPPTPTRKNPKLPQTSLTLEKALPLLEKIAQEIISEDKEHEPSSRNGKELSLENFLTFLCRFTLPDWRKMDKQSRRYQAETQHDGQRKN